MHPVAGQKKVQCLFSGVILTSVNSGVAKTRAALFQMGLGCGSLAENNYPPLLSVSGLDDLSY